MSAGSAVGPPLAPLLSQDSGNTALLFFPAHPGISPQLNVCLSLDNKPDIQVQHSTFVGYFLHVG